jgi:ABC-2 type transport system permease protein
VIALAGHTFLSNLYLGIFSLLLVWVGKDQLPRLGIDSYLLRFNTTPPLIYSDLNGFGHGLSATFRLHAYWLAFSVIVLVVVYLFWRRGVPSVFAARMRKAAGNWRGRPLYLSVGAVVLMLLLGISIFRAERMDVRISGEDGPDLEHFKQQYDSYREAIQPRITTVRLNLHLQPDSCAFRASGSYVLVNKSREDISTLLIRTGYDEITDYTIGWGNTLISRDSGFKFAVHELNPPLPPGDSLLFHFHIHSMPNTLLSRHSGVLENGTFLRTDILPRFGYFADRESYTPSDSLVATRNFYADDADLVHFRTTISTMTGQVAIAPGYLTGSRQEAGRTHFTYRTENPVKMAAAFNSGRYQIREERHENVLLQVYHHAAHGRNVEQMLSGLKAALDYNTHYFAPYQHRSARIIEFPVSEGTYATTMANTIPISEQRFVIRSPEDAGKIDLSFYVPAHELTHQWWGNQLVPAHAAGAKMLTESITEYISLNLYEQQFGKAAARQFLQLQHRRYLTGRTRERKTENPLYLISSEQEYIAYGKGAMAFHALKHYWGEAALNEALSEFLHTYRFRTDRYPTSGDLLDLLKKHMPDELQYLIADYFENITFYDNGVEQVAVHPDGNGAYTVSALLRLRKYRLEPEEKEVPLRDLLEVAAYNDQGALLWVKKIRVNAPQMSFDWLVQERPARIVIDPNYLLPDLNMADNFFDL